VALSGSAANLAVAAVFFLVVSLLGGPGQIFHVAEIPGKFALVLIRMNLAMGLVNLLPLPPFDGVRLVDLAGFRLSRLEPFGAVAFFVAGAAGLAPLVSAATDGIVRRML
jgi:membrane-associated protease RseP (regulator of RpoE activity)